MKFNIEDLYHFKKVDMLPISYKILMGNYQKLKEENDQLKNKLELKCNSPDYTEYLEDICEEITSNIISMIELLNTIRGSKISKEFVTIIRERADIAAEAFKIVLKENEKLKERIKELEEEV